ncbi:hypothetical protein FXV91_12060 [Methanosarcina sp. DH2]|uniref:SpvB/TcaC N-terminal domain-containing protein n=1 Tax=Methanosarcina sp. DH2 TaxID=2605639 RepID=UPI001E2E06A7|nr:SpvB/TcaC N-terminal domain-containing protein [Methanosarcina sp. DH2]MCC4770886.1 hypothetical protein [Methanosarcina sp. DH2]
MSPIYNKRLISILMLIILLTPNAYCLENVETSPDGSSESLQADSDSYEENNENIIDEEKTSEIVSVIDSESVDDNSENIPTDTVVPESAVSEDDIEPLGNAKAYLNPTLENENDYFDTSLFTGSFVYSYPIETLRGRTGLGPKVSLTYSSFMGSRGTYGSLGMGWSLNENCIIRDTRYTPENISDDRFILILDGSTYKLVYVEGDNSYHSEIESFMKIEKSTTGSNSFGDYWILKMPDGTKYRFGYNSDSEQRNSIESRNYVSKWWLDLIEDINGNQIRYTYFENPASGEIGSTYLDSITYNDNHAVINFEFTEKPRSFTGYEYGNKISEKSLISSITVRNDETVLWKYNLEYESQQSKSYLKSITKTGLNSTEFPPTIFEYNSLTGGWQESSLWSTSVSTSGRDKGIRFVDVNGDGLEDILEGYVDDLNRVRCSTWINTGDSWELNSSWATPTCFRDYTEDAGARLADVNGDGLVDIIQHSIDISSAWLNNGTGWEQNNSWAPPLYFGYSSDQGVRIADVNGDGLVDIIKGYRYVGTEQYDAYINTGAGWRQDNSWNPPTYFVDTGFDQGILLADINGDGLVDLVKEGSAWLNNGSGWEHDNSWGSPVSLNSLNTV